MRRLSEWSQPTLPQPPPYSLRNAARVIGPAAILLGLSLGAGDWILGPAIAARHGVTVLWISTASVVLQALLNTEMARYTLATGEPIFAGFMRTPPATSVWAWTYVVLHSIQTVWPGWALAAATALCAAFLGRLPRDEDRVAVQALGYVTLLAAVGTALLGARTHRALERVEWVMTAVILGFLLLVGIFFVPWTRWLDVAAGFVSPLVDDRLLPDDLDWTLLAAFAAYAGAGGTINATLTYWLRDKGFGMAGTVGSVPTRVSGPKMLLSQEGGLFALSPENLVKWHGWWRYMRAGLWYVWTVGRLTGMGLTVLVTVHFVERGSEIGSLGVGAVLAHALERHGLLLWFWSLLAGFWILFWNQLGIVEGFARSATDMLWTASPRLRAWRGGKPRAIYHAALALFALGSGALMTLTSPFKLILIGANVAALNLAILSAHTLWVNRALLPRELRPSLWREAGVAACGVFFAWLVAKAFTHPAQLRSLFSP